MSLHPSAPLGAALAIAGAALIWVSRQGTRAAASVGLVVALLATGGFGAGAFAPLALFVLGSGVLTRAGRATKERLGVEEPNRGRRDVSQVVAKLALPAAAGALAIVRAAPPGALALVYVASLAGAFADTAATELGPLGGGRVLVRRGLRFETGRHGAPGGISASGVAFAALASSAVAWGAWCVGLLQGTDAAWGAAASGLVASLLESLLAGSGVGDRVGHFGRNVFVSFASAILAITARGAGWIGS